MQPIQSYALNPTFVNTVVPGWDTASKIIKVVLTPLAYLSQLYSSSNKIEPPSAPGHAIVGSLPELKAMNWDVLNFLVAYHRKYGGKAGISKVNLVNKVFYIISDPAKAKQILQMPKSFIRGKSLEAWRSKFSKGGLEEGVEAQKYRKDAMNAISETELPSYFEGLVRVSQAWVERIGRLVGADLPINLLEETERVTLAATGESFFRRYENEAEENPFGLTLEKDEVCTEFLHSFRNLFAMLTNRLSSGLTSIPYIGDALYSWIYSGEEEKLISSKEKLEKILIPIFNRRDCDMMRLFKHFDINSSETEMEDKLNQCLGFLQASFETASKALCWSLFVLSNNQELQNELREQLREKFGKNPPKNLEELKSIPLLAQIIEETLRLFPPFPFLLRDIEKPEDFKVYDVQKGGTFIISPLLIHRNGEHWEEPDKFNPERFSEKLLSDGTQFVTSKYMPFLRGVHRCPGRFFAKQEVMVFLSQLILNYEVSRDVVEFKEMSRLESTGLKLNITLHPKNPIMVNIKSIALL